MSIASIIASNLNSFLTFLLTSLLLVWFWLQYRFNYWKRHKIPNIEPSYFFGNFKDVILMKKNVCSVLTEFYWHPNAKDKAVVGIYVLNRPGLLIRDVDLIKNILIKDFHKFSNRFSSSDPHSDPLGADNLFFMKNPKWKLMRSKLTPVFTSGKMRQMFPLVAEIGQQLDKYLCNLTQSAAHKIIMKEVKDVSTSYAIDVIASIAYGIDAQSFTNDDNIFRAAGNQVFNFTTRRALEVYSMFFSPYLVKMFGFKVFTPEATIFLRNLINQVMDERIKTGLKRNDLIDILINFRHEAEAASVENQLYTIQGDSLVAQAAIFFTAGFETSSSTISFSLFELAHHQDLQARLRAEIRDALEANNGELTYEVINELKFLDNVVRETLRLYPIMPFLQRECTLIAEEVGYSLQPFCNFQIPNGMPVYIPLYQLQRDAKYFPEPDRFNPDRFSSAQINNNNMAAYLPFGMGPHNCIGERFGRMQTKVGLINFLRNHCVKPSDQLPRELKFNARAITLQPTGGVLLKIVYDPLA